MTVAVEVGQLSRFDGPRADGLQRPRARARIRAEARRVAARSPRRATVTCAGSLVEAAWSYRDPARSVRRSSEGRQHGQPETIKAIAWKAQHRLHGRFRRLAARGKPHPQVVTAVARELLGFVWAIGVHVEKQQAAAA